MNRTKKSEKGQAIVLIAFAIIGMIALVAIGLDGGQTLSDRRHAQNAVDAAAYSSALAWTKDEDFTAKGQALITSNGYDIASDPNAITAVDDNSGCLGGMTGKEFTVDLTSTVKMWFAPIIGVTDMHNSVTATSRACKTNNLPMYDGAAVFSLKTGDCGGASDADLLLSGSGTLEIFGGGLASNSPDPRCTNIDGGSAIIHCAGVTTGAPGPIGSNIVFVTDGGCPPGTIQYNIPSATLPPLVDYHCGGAPASPGQPGTYNGRFPPSSVSHLAPGLYCLTGDFDMNASDTLTGAGVTFVMLTNGGTWNGGASVNLTAPTHDPTLVTNQQGLAAGAIAGMLIYAPPTNANKIELAGNGDSYLQGTILAPAADCYYAGTGNVQRSKVQFICYQWRFNGNANAQIEYDPSVLYVPKTTVSIIH